MRFTAPKDVIVQAIANVGKATGSPGGAHSLHGVRFAVTGKRLLLTGTDLDKTISQRLDVTDGEDGTIIVPSRIIAEIVKNLPGDEITVVAENDDEAQVSGGGPSFTVRLLPVSTFPDVEELATPGSKISAKAFADALAEVTVAASSDTARPILTGVHIAATDDGVRLQATDSYRLAVRNLTGSGTLDADTSVVVPAAQLKLLGSLFSSAEEVEVRLSPTTVTFASGDLRLTSRLIAGDFPNTAGLLAGQPILTVLADRQHLIDAVKRAKIVAGPKAVTLSFADGACTVSCENAEDGSHFESFDVETDGAELVVGFNPMYLLPVLAVIPGATVKLAMIDSAKATTITSTDDTDLVTLVMPVRV